MTEAEILKIIADNSGAVLMAVVGVIAIKAITKLVAVLKNGASDKLGKIAEATTEFAKSAGQIIKQNAVIISHHEITQATLLQQTTILNQLVVRSQESNALQAQGNKISTEQIKHDNEEKP